MASNSSLPNPQSITEEYLKVIAENTSDNNEDSDVTTLPTPQSVADQYLKAIAENTSGGSRSGGGSSGGGALVTEVAFDLQTHSLTLDKTAGELWDAGFAVVSMDMTQAGDVGKYLYPMIAMADIGESGYEFAISTGNQEELVFTATSADDYPAVTLDDDPVLISPEAD